jgi:hypothetical protein
MKSLLLLSALLALAGCATVESVLSKNTLAAQLVVQEATARVIEAGHSPMEQQLRAQNIAKTVAAIKTTFDTTATTLPNLVDLASQRIIALKLGPADAILAQAFVSTLSQMVQAKVCSAANTGTPCTIPADKVFWVDSVLSWVTATTKLYGG